MSMFSFRPALACSLTLAVLISTPSSIPASPNRPALPAVGDISRSENNNAGDPQTPNASQARAALEQGKALLSRNQ
ncbi:MAG: hypothetical protein ACRD68_12165, partial [Pyrinomonadaceae bacterium]